MRKAVLILLMFMFLTMSISFGLVSNETRNLALIVPCLLGLIGFVLSTILLFKKQLQYCFFDKALLVKQNGRIVDRITKTDVYSLKFVYDVFDESLYMVQFKTQKKQYNIPINDKNRDDILLFFKGATKTVSHNSLYYLVIFLVS